MRTRARIVPSVKHRGDGFDDGPVKGATEVPSDVRAAAAPGADGVGAQLAMVRDRDKADLRGVSLSVTVVV